MARSPRISLALSALAASLLLAACGGGSSSNGSNNGSAAGSGNIGSGSSGAGSAAPQLLINSFEAAQTHVLPEAGLSWSLPGAKGTLHLSAQRDALVMVDLGAAQPQRPVLEAWLNNSKLGALALNTPDRLPPTEAAGPAYAGNRYSVTLPAAWVTPGVMLRVSADNYAASDFKQPEVGMDADFDMRILPFYLFGANDSNTQPFSVTANPDAATYQELYAKWPVAKLNMHNHPAGRVIWPYYIIGPDGKGNAAYRVTNKDQQKDGYAIMGATLPILSAIRSANGEAGTNNQYYAPLLMLGANGAYADPWGGLGSVGGSVATGDFRYAGVFIHEQGHAFGMPHAGDAYANGAYPYISGSLLGSAWGYDAGRGQLLAPFLPTTADSYKNCQSSSSRIKDGSGRCIKQDPMQGGSGDQAAGYRFTMFSDFNAGVIQRYFEGQTTADAKGVHKYSGGRIFVDQASATGYSRWDGIAKKRVAVTPATTDGGLYGFDMGLPSQRNVPVQTIVITYSLAGTAGVSQIYPPLAYQGNLVRQVDPTAPAQLAQITPNTGATPWYCHASGCDYTVRVTYGDGSLLHVLLQGGARPWFSPTGAIPAAALDPLNGDSFKVWGINVPANKSISKIELLDTPMGWNGVPANPTVLLSR
ncbi:M66 family metalloprotease [Paraherbaspirillum soli]|uniref:Dictomallein n=1 Tax=Paraherbaspirillum soli TaxID=631222 RepID=A0ABW0M4I8_9BURK